MTSTATRASCDALCASIGSPTTSPIAKIDGSSVRRCSSTLMKPRRVDLHARLVEAGDRRSSAAGRPTTSTRSNICSSASAPRPRSVTRIPSRLVLHLDDLRVQQDRSRTVSSSRFGEDVHEIAIGAGQQPGRHFDDGDLAAERRVHRAQFQSDVAAADDEQRLRNVRQIERAGRIHHARTVDRRAPGSRRARAGREDRVLERQRLLAAAASVDFERRAHRRTPPCPARTVPCAASRAGPRPPVSLSTTPSLNPRSLSRSIFGSANRCPRSSACCASSITWRRGAAPWKECSRDRGRRRRDSLPDRRA